MCLQRDSEQTANCRAWAGLVLKRILISNTRKKKIPFGSRFHVPEVVISTILRLMDDSFFLELSCNDRVKES